MISRAMGKLDRPLGKDVLAEVMVEFREMAKEQAEAARAGDKEAQQKRVYYQGTLETDKANYQPPGGRGHCARSFHFSRHIPAASPWTAVGCPGSPRDRPGPPWPPLP
jgi:hypothetical protein